MAFKSKKFMEEKLYNEYSKEDSILDFTSTINDGRKLTFTMNVDEATYAILSATNVIVYSNFEQLSESSEAGGEYNFVR
jgi:hypothetical protein